MTPSESMRKLADLLDTLNSAEASPASRELLVRYGEDLVAASSGVTQRYLSLLANPPPAKAESDTPVSDNAEATPA